MSKSFLLLAYVIFPICVQAQFATCELEVPTLDGPSDTSICVDEQSAPVNITNQTGLPTIEYAVIDVNLPSTSNPDEPTILGFTDNPFFNPSDFGITSATTVEFIGVTYDLPTVQTIIDGLLTGQTPSGSCCDLNETFMDLCDGFVSVGVSQGSDFTNLNELLTTLNPNGDNLSINDVNFILLVLDLLFSDPNEVPMACGGGNPICYAYTAPIQFEIIVPPAEITYGTGDHSQSITAFASKITSSATVQSNQTVDYQYRKEVLLEDPFTTQQGGLLTVERRGCD